MMLMDMNQTVRLIKTQFLQSTADKVALYKHAHHESGFQDHTSYEKTTESEARSFKISALPWKDVSHSWCSLGPHNRVYILQINSDWEHYISVNLSSYLGNTMPEIPNMLIAKILLKWKNPFQTFQFQDHKMWENHTRVGPTHERYFLNYSRKNTSTILIILGI